MDQEKLETVAEVEEAAAKKLRKAELKSAEKAKKTVKAEKKLAKQAEKAAKEAQKAQQKLDKRKTAEAILEPKEDPGKTEKPTAAKKAKLEKTKSGPALTLSLGAKLQAVARQARSNLAAGLLKHGLYAGQEQVLFLLDEYGPLALAELAEKLDVRAPTITKTVTRMEAQGFLSRAVSRDDARSTIIALAPEGRRVLKIGRKIVQDVEKNTFFGLSETDCRNLEKHLDSVLLQLKQSQ